MWGAQPEWSGGYLREVLGPIDFVVVRFPGTTISGDVTAGLRELTESGTIRIIDLIFVSRDADDGITVVELADLDDDTYSLWDAIVGDVSGMLGESDTDLVAATLPPDSSALLALIENSWAQSMVRAIKAADGEVLISERIPRAIVDELATTV